MPQEHMNDKSYHNELWNWNIEAQQKSQLKTRRGYETGHQ